MRFRKVKTGLYDFLQLNWKVHVCNWWEKMGKGVGSR